jgi:hypothetical protein
MKQTRLLRLLVCFMKSPDVADENIFLWDAAVAVGRLGAD